jgi:hypothetical protein
MVLINNMPSYPEEITLQIPVARDLFMVDEGKRIRASEMPSAIKN